MNLWLIGVSQSVSMGTCGVLAVQHFTHPVLWVWFCVRALFRWDNCAGRAAVLAMGILKPFFSKRKIQLQCINLSSSCLTLGKRNGCQPWAICCLFLAGYWRIQIANRWLGSFCKQVKLHWSWWSHAPSFTAAQCLRHHGNTDTPVTGCKSPSVLTMIMRKPTGTKQPAHRSNTATASKYDKNICQSDRNQRK